MKAFDPTHQPWPHTSPHSRCVRVNGVRWHYKEFPGNGPAVVLIHGLAAACHTWDALAGYLHDLDCHVYAPDMRGFGWSEKPKNAAYDVESLMEDVSAWMDAVGLERAVLVGNSLGGAVASLMALEKPEKVERLVLLNALAPYDDIPFPWVFKLARLPGAAQLAPWVFFRPMLRRVLQGLFFDPGHATHEKVESYYSRLSTQNALHCTVQAIRALDPHRFAHHLTGPKAIVCPVLMIWGQDDPWLPLRFGRRLHNQGKGHGTFAVLSRCGHMPQEEKPVQTGRLIAGFLEGRPLRAGDHPDCPLVEHRYPDGGWAQSLAPAWTRAVAATNQDMPPSLNA